MAFLGKKLIFGVLSVAAGLAWISFGGGATGDYEELDRMPARVFGGGAGTLSLEIETSQPAELSASFHQYDESDGSQSDTYVSEEMAIGRHTRKVAVAPDTYIYVEVEIPDASVGATLSWTVLLDGFEIFREDDRLDEPLDGDAFFLQFEAEDIREIRSWNQ